MPGGLTVCATCVASVVFPGSGPIVRPAGSRLAEMCPPEWNGPSPLCMRLPGYGIQNAALVVGLSLGSRPCRKRVASMPPTDISASM